MNANYIHGIALMNGQSSKGLYGGQFPLYKLNGYPIEILYCTAYY